MIILISGASHCGKTFLAQKLLEKLQFPYLSIDHLKMGLIRSGNTSLTPEDDEELTGYLWPVVREMIKTAVENEQNLIVEGCYVPSGWRQDLDESYLKQICFIVLAFSDRYIKENIGQINAHDSVIENRMHHGNCSIDFLQQENHRYINDFREDVIVIDDDFNKAIDDISQGVCLWSTSR